MAKLKLTLSAVTAPGFLAALQKLGEEDGLSVKDRYALAKTMRGIAEAAQLHEETRAALVKKHGAEKDGQYVVEPKNLESFFAEFKELGAQKVELFLDHKLPLSETSRLTAGEIALLIELLKEEGA